MSSVKLVTSQLLQECIENIQRSDAICLLVSFAMESGVRLLAPALREAAQRGADVKVLTGDYLFVTQPNALTEITAIHPDVHVRLWKSDGTSFHPKAYIFRKAADDVVIVGSSNLSGSALTTGVEWSLSATGQAPYATADEAEERFLELFYSEQTVPVNPVSIGEYRANYADYHMTHPSLADTWTEAEAVTAMLDPVEVQTMTAQVHETAQPYPAPFRPRPAQVEALRQLQATRAEGYDKALVVMATGLGKTYLAAMFARQFKRVLFIAHRDEILFQAQRAFRAIMPDKRSGLYTGRQKDTGVDLVFASIMTLGQKRHRTRFARGHFDLIVVDEFHHAAAATYQAVIDWFQPEFLLGITATPDRADNRDVYALCDGNVAYRIDFLEAVRRQWLVPFHYYGVYDDTDYSHIRWLGTRYDEQELLAAQTRDGMAAQIFSAWQRHRQTRGIAFCSSVVQAQFLAAYFEREGVRCTCLHGGSPHATRAAVIRKVNAGELELVFTVDLFNEGVDIPAVDTLLFVRPTESLTVFTQQVGRGLRRHEGKQHCTIIDLIGNYRNADLKLSLFDTVVASEGIEKAHVWTFPPRVPDGCAVNLDTKVIDLIDALRKKRQPRKQKLREDYFDAKRELGRRPTYLEAHLHGQWGGLEMRQEFGGYYAFLAEIGELDRSELDAFEVHRGWLRELETTGMTKSYKMALLLAMLERGEADWFKPITPRQAAPFFHSFYMEKEYRRKTDFNDRTTKALVDYDEGKVADLIARMPMTMWSQSSKGFARLKDGQFWFEVQNADLRHLFEWTRDVCQYRLHYYFRRKTV